MHFVLEMEATKENNKFWSTLEHDLKEEIPIHIRNTLKYIIISHWFHYIYTDLINF